MQGPSRAGRQWAARSRWLGVWQAARGSPQRSGTGGCMPDVCWLAAAPAAPPPRNPPSAPSFAPPQLQGGLGLVCGCLAGGAGGAARLRLPLAPAGAGPGLGWLGLCLLAADSPGAGLRQPTGRPAARAKATQQVLQPGASWLSGCVQAEQAMRASGKPAMTDEQVGWARSGGTNQGIASLQQP